MKIKKDAVPSKVSKCIVEKSHFFSVFKFI